MAKGKCPSCKAPYSRGRGGWLRRRCQNRGCALYDVSRQATGTRSSDRRMRAFDAYHYGG